MHIAGVGVENLEFKNIGNWPRPFKFVVLLLFAMFILFLGYYFFISNYLDELDAKEDQRIKLQSSYSRTHTEVINLDLYRKQVETVQKNLALITQQLPRGVEEATLLKDISQLASASGLQFVAIKPLPEVKKTFYY